MTITAQAVRARGAVILDLCAARAIEIQARLVIGVLTERGSNRPHMCCCLAAPGRKPIDAEGCRRELEGRHSTGARVSTGPMTLGSFRLLPDFRPLARGQHHGDGLNTPLGRNFLRSLVARTRWRDDEVSPLERAHCVAHA